MSVRIVPLLEVALNGSRDHAGVPRTAEQLAAAAHAAVAEGARVIHMHPYDALGRAVRHQESLRARAGRAARCGRRRRPRAAAIEKVLMRPGVSIEQVHHGDGLARWAVNRRALERGHGIRTGLEDTTVLPDGRPARDNAALVRAAAAMIAAGSRVASLRAEGSR
jgi:uncharacterized protein (DUF849 family)